MINLILIMLLFRIKHCQHYIWNGKIPSYLYHNWPDIKEEVFPHDIRINVSLSRISGTLLYSIDRRMNQLIVSLQDGLTPTLAIEFSRQNHYLSLSRLCGCDQCKFEILDLRIQMRDSMYVQCGARPLEIIRYNRSRQINKAYPMVYNSTKVDASFPNEAHLWLVNTPQYGALYPNNKQLSGCIFNVSYNNREIIFTNITANIGRACHKTCIGDICNGGQCYETYSMEPVCNCTMTYLIGQYCNDTIYSMNLRTVSQYFIFDMFKVSWISSVNEIAQWKSKEACIQISRHKSTMTFEFQFWKGGRTTVRCDLSEDYIPNRESILLVYFQESTIEIWFYNNATCHHSVIPTNRDLRREIFDSLTVVSGPGNIRVAFKTSPKDNAWRPIYVQKYEEIKIDDEGVPIFTRFNREMLQNGSIKTQNTFWGAMVVTVGIFLVIASLSVIICPAIVMRSRRSATFIPTPKLLGSIADVEAIEIPLVQLDEDTEMEQTEIPSSGRHQQTGSGSTVYFSTYDVQSSLKMNSFGVLNVSDDQSSCGDKKMGHFGIPFRGRDQQTGSGSTMYHSTCDVQFSLKTKSLPNPKLPRCIEDEEAIGIPLVQLDEDTEMEEIGVLNVSDDQSSCGDKKMGHLNEHLGDSGISDNRTD